MYSSISGFLEFLHLVLQESGPENRNVKKHLIEEYTHMPIPDMCLARLDPPSSLSPALGRPDHPLATGTPPPPPRDRAPCGKPLLTRMCRSWNRGRRGRRTCLSTRGPWCRSDWFMFRVVFASLRALAGVRICVPACPRGKEENRCWHTNNIFYFSESGR